MLHLYRRHGDNCPEWKRRGKNPGMGFHKCPCPVWVHGKLRGTFIQRSLETVNWETGHKIRREWEDSGNSGNKNMGAACDAFISDCEARGLSSESMGKYKLLRRELKERFGRRPVGSISVPDLRTYRESWKMAPISAGKKLERLRTFFKFCLESGWTRENPAKVLKLPLARPMPTLPFSPEHIEKILWATEVYPRKGIYRDATGKRIRAFINLLLYSGLRIRDAATLEAEKLQGNKLRLYTQKTGQHVWLPLPKWLVKDLHEVNPGGRYFFWSGNGLAKSAVANWQRSLAKVFKLAGIKGHAHRFRDTFSVNLLEAGVSIETVSILLAHSSVRVTEKHYSPWVKSRQVKLEESIEKAWKLT